MIAGVSVAIISVVAIGVTGSVVQESNLYWKIVPAFITTTSLGVLVALRSLYMNRYPGHIDDWSYGTLPSRRESDVGI
jgi:hypothetical protein